MKGVLQLLELTCPTVCACLFKLRPGVLSKILSHMWGKLNLFMFLFNVGLLTLMNMDSLIFLAKLCPSLPIIWKLLWLVGWPVWLMCWQMGEGSISIRCSLYLSPKVLEVSPMYSSSQERSPRWNQYMVPLLLKDLLEPISGAVFQFSLRPDEVHSSEWKLVYNYNQSSVPEKNHLCTSRDNRMRNLHKIIHRCFLVILSKPLILCYIQSVTL